MSEVQILSPRPLRDGPTGSGEHIDGAGTNFQTGEDGDAIRIEGAEMGASLRTGEPPRQLLRTGLAALRRGHQVRTRS